MKNLLLSSRSNTILRTASIALALAVLPGVLGLQAAHAQTYTVLHTFTGAPDGESPYAGLLRDTKENLYGTTYLGGNHTCPPPYNSCGMIFKIDTAGKETVLYSFDNENGQQPPVGYIALFDTKSNLYGITVNGGRFGMGAAFQLSPAGKYTVLHNFSGGPTGLHPWLVARDQSGNLYGTTVTGGNSTDSGVVFKLNKFGKETVLYTFTCPECNGQKGTGFGYPGGSTRDSAGNLYGIAAGGTIDCGVVYKLGKSGAATVLYNFKGGRNGFAPNGDLIRDAAGNLYGTTLDPDGSFCSIYGCGTVFKVDPKGHETVLYRFTGGTDGGHPTGGLVRDPQGNLYGTTWIGGSNSSSCGDLYDRGCGVVFKIDPSGTETVLYTFLNGTEGGYPNGGLVRDEAGNLYGTTTSGGDPTCSCGVVFKITP